MRSMLKSESPWDREDVCGEYGLGSIALYVGLLLEYRGVKLLVDAIYHTTDPLFASGVTNRQRANSRQLTGEYV